LKNRFQHIIYPFAGEILHSYSILFFSDNRLLGLLLLIVTFFKPFAGVAGLIAVIIAIGFSYFSGLRKTGFQPGLLSYNALLVGIGMGTFYNAGIAFWLLLFLTVLLSVVLSSGTHPALNSSPTRRSSDLGSQVLTRRRRRARGRRGTARGGSLCTSATELRRFLRGGGAGPVHGAHQAIQIGRAHV